MRATDPGRKRGKSKQPVDRFAPPAVQDVKSSKDLSRGKEYKARLDAEVRDVKSSADLGRAKVEQRKGRDEYFNPLKMAQVILKTRKMPHDKDAPQTQALASRLSGLQGKELKGVAIDAADVKAASTVEPGLKIMNELMRTSRAVAAGGKAAMGGADPVQAAAFGVREGLIKNKPYSWQKNLQEAGVPRGASDVLGFAGDAVLDPLNLYSGGLASVAKTGAKAGVKSAARGIEIKLAGKSVPGVTKATARVGEATQGLRNTPVAQEGRRLLGEVSPRTRQGTMSSQEAAELRRAGRSSRATMRDAEIKGSDVYSKVMKATGDKKRAKEAQQGVIDKGRERAYAQFDEVAKKTSADAETISGLRESINPYVRRSMTGRAVDKVSGFTKAAVRLDPGFKLANFYGDQLSTYFVTPNHQLPKAHRDANRILKGSDKPVDIGNGQRIPAAEAARELEKRGLQTSTYRRGEIQTQTAGKKAPGKVRAAARKPGDWMETEPRIATAIAAKRRGMSWDEAVEESLENAHVDYMQKTPAEKAVFARAPFYTAAARFPSIAVRGTLKRPSKVANFQKAREDLSRSATGEDQDPSKKLTEAEQRIMATAVKGGSVGLSQLPWQSLNLLAANPKDMYKKVFEQAIGLTPPIVGAGIAAGTGYDLRLGNEIGEGMVPAPAAAKKLPQPVKDVLGVKKGKNKRTGKAEEMWPAEHDYAARVGTPGFLGKALELAALVTGEKNSRPTAPNPLLSELGVKYRKSQKQNPQLESLYLKQRENSIKLERLNDLGIGEDNPTRQWKKLRLEAASITDAINEAKASRGDANAQEPSFRDQIDKERRQMQFERENADLIRQEERARIERERRKIQRSRR